MKKAVSEINCDAAAGTPLAPEVFAVMEPWLTDRFANPSGSYRAGREARAAIDQAREEIAQIFHCTPNEIVFTSGATEANNIALQGTVAATNGNIITTTIEHPSVKEVVSAIEQNTQRVVSWIDPDSDGIIDSELIADAVTDPTALVSVIFVNNEIGTMQSIAEIVSAVKQKNPHTRVHTDASQAANFFSLDTTLYGVDMMTVSASKIHGPQGVGVLFLKAGNVLSPLFFGGDQERGIRPGTENVAAIVGCAQALTRADAIRAQEAARLHALREMFETQLVQLIPQARINGHVTQRAPHIVNICFPGVSGESLVFALDQAGIAVSMGSACAAGSLEPSHVLLAMGLSRDDARSSVRFSFHRNTTEEEVKHVLAVLPSIVESVRV